RRARQASRARARRASGKAWTSSRRLAGGRGGAQAPLAEHRFGNRQRHRAWSFYQSDDWQGDQEVGEVVGGGGGGRNDIAAFRRLRAEVTEAYAGEREYPEELAIDRAISRRADARSVKPGHEHQDCDGREERDHPQELVRDGAENGVEGQEI